MLILVRYRLYNSTKKWLRNRREHADKVTSVPEPQGPEYMKLKEEV